MKHRKLYQIHAQRGSLWHGEQDSLAVTYCGERVSVRDNRQRLTQDRREVTCKRCRQLLPPPHLAYP
jgi:hypothetical protein